jgi:predicted ATPase
VRFSRILISNYKGIARAEFTGLDEQPVVTISGRNGTGKSLLLEALVAAWTGRYQMQMQERVGPWSDQLVIELNMTLTDDEWSILEHWHEQMGSAKPQREPLECRMTVNRMGGGGRSESMVTRILRDATFQRDNPFSIVDFLPASRLLTNAPSPNVDLTMLNLNRVQDERHQMMDRFINQRAPMSLPSVSSYLATLDYQSFIAERQGLSIPNDYNILKSAFDSASGKQLRLPEYDAARGSNILIELPTGQRHGLSELSSGEQEMLAMMFFVRRLSASGGVLCIDEPEQHLHPTLQAALFDAMTNLAERSQIFVVSHSVNLIAASPISGLIQLKPPLNSDTNQVQKLEDNPDKVNLVAELGITPADLFQSDMLLVVEGDTDSQWLRQLFPVEIGKAHVMVAGSARQVINTMATLGSVPSGLPWLCLRDKDLMTDEERTELMANHTNLYVWPRRAIESMLLDARLIQAAMEPLGVSIAIEEIDGWLEDAAAPLQEDVLEGLVNAELMRREPQPEVPDASSGGRFDRIEEHLRRYAAVNTRRADLVAAIVSEERQKLATRWPQDWKTLVNPKPVLAQVGNRIGKLRTAADFTSALFNRARLDESVRPKPFEEFRLRLVGATSGN